MLGCDGLGPLRRCFSPTNPSPKIYHFDFISTIRSEIHKLVIKWNWHHIEGHQDEKTDASNLDIWAWLNIEMDQCAKLEWDNRWACSVDETLQVIPSEGWLIWYGDCKLSNLARSTFDALIKPTYSTNYWKQAGKLGDHFNYIDWEACGDAYRSVSTIQQIKLTKWVTGWLPVAKNMFWWHFWGTKVCPCCGVSQEDTDHLFCCKDPGMQAIRWTANATLEHDLYSIGIIPQLVPLFVKMLNNESNMESSLNVEIFQAFQIQ